MLNEAIFSCEGPAAVRYPRGSSCSFSGFSPNPEMLLESGSDCTMICYGTMTETVLHAASMLREKGIMPEVIKLNRVSGNAFPIVMCSLEKTGILIAAEEVCAAGCMGSVLTAAAAVEGISLRAVKLMNLGNGIVPHGSRELLMRDFGIDSESIVRQTMDCL